MKRKHIYVIEANIDGTWNLQSECYEEREKEQLNEDIKKSRELCPYNKFRIVKFKRVNQNKEEKC